MSQSKLTFRNVHIRYLDVRRKEESVPFVRIHMTADLTDVVAAAMGWEMPGDGLTKGDLAGRLSANYMILTPNEKGLRERELQVEVAAAEKFKFVGEKDEETGRVHAAEIRFIVRSNLEGVEGLLTEYWRACGDSDAQMKLSYTPEPVQQALPGAQAEAAPAEEPDDAEPAAGPALASAQSMKRGKKGGAE